MALLALSLTMVYGQNSTIELSGLTIAVTNTTEMLRFYEKVFNCNFKEEKAGGSRLYKTKLAGISTVFCPNELANVDARQNRQQFEFDVPDLSKIRELVKNNGGRIRNHAATSGVNRQFSVIDPDGNTIIFVQK